MRVGITGHRVIRDEASVSRAVEEVLSRIREKEAKGGNPDPGIELVTSLAEGADRIVALEVLKEPKAVLRVPLPFPPEKYIEDFAEGRSRAEFEGLLARAAEVIVLPAAATHEEGYAKAGDYVLDNCDVLIAIWDGESSRGQGGTAEVVAIARERGLPLFWIHADEPGVITEELGSDF